MIQLMRLRKRHLMKDGFSRASIAMASFFFLTLVSSALLLGFSSTPTEAAVALPELGHEGEGCTFAHSVDLFQFERFEATAYCDNGITFSGVRVRRGIVAADPDILPISSVIEVQAGRYSGIYTVMDTGDAIKGTIIDIDMPNHEEAIQFGRRPVQIRVLRYGWNHTPIGTSAATGQTLG